MPQQKEPKIPVRVKGSERESQGGKKQSEKVSGNSGRERQRVKGERVREREAETQTESVIRRVREVGESETQS